MSVQARSRCTWLVAAALAAAAPALPAQSQDWPTQPIRVIHPFAPGGGAETLARPVMDGLSRKFGQQFFVENRPGAAGILGAQIVAKAFPDGYTLLVSGVSPRMLEQALAWSTP